MNNEEFITCLKDLNIEVTPEKLALLDLYFKELIAYNKHTNLTAITKEEDVYLKHFYDSLTICKIIDLTKEETILDIGSGAGFPGLVLKIFFPHLKVTLIDSNNKKTKFLEYMVAKLTLKDVTIINERVEKLALKSLNSFDIVTARAVTKLNILAELALPLVKINKYFIAMKANVDLELEDGTFAINYLGGKIEEKLTFNLYDDANLRTLIKVVKVKETENKNLRPYDKIVKKPLQKKA